MKQPYALHWFRRDLRVSGNPALDRVRREHRGRVLGLFCVDSQILARPDFSHDRFQFFLETLRALKEELREEGGDLRVLDARPVDAFGLLFDHLLSKAALLPSEVSWNRDYEPFALDRDARVEALLRSRYGVRVHTERDHLLIEPGEVAKSDGATDFKVFTPFAKSWLRKFSSSDVQERLRFDEAFPRSDRPRFSLRWDEVLGSRIADPLNDALERIHAMNLVRARVPIPKAGHAEAMRALREFKDRMDRYGDERDYPSIPGTSRLSIFLKNGSLTLARIVSELGFTRTREPGKAPKFLNELIWREFCYSLLTHFPRVERSAFRPQYDAIEWENRAEFFEAWKRGLTGYPLVDAGMRQLRETGWMHNRVRMIVASFLVKDLHVDWRWGEKYFMQTLLDGDLAPNNGGWQWAASTGADPQPYFRIFNPTLQSKRFDADGDYIRRWVPELRHLDRRKIHAPPRDLVRGRYPEPVVAHGPRAMKAIRLFTDVSTAHEK